MNRRTFLKGCTAGGAVLAMGGAGGMAFLDSAAFGALPEGKELQRILLSPHQQGGVFVNLEPAPVLADNSNFVVSLARWLMLKRERPKPQKPLPHVRVDVRNLEENALVWLGHSSFFLRLAGKNILIDPVFSDYGSPFFFSNRAFAGTTFVTADEMPRIDLLLITHDHWDHLDYHTVMALKDRIGCVVCGLGTGAHFRRWGFADKSILEGDWGESLDFGELKIHFITSRHFAGRSLKNHDRALWCGFVLDVPGFRLLHSGDGGYGSHFKALGERLGAVDLAIMDSGQYNKNWPTVHMFPHEAVQAALDVGACHFMPAHIGRFCLSQHSWDEPFVLAAQKASEKNLPLFTPLMGKVIPLTRELPAQPHWWEGLE